MTQTSHSSSHNPGDHGILLRIPGAYSNVDDSLHENKIGGIRGDGERRGSRYQYISHSYFHNDVESVDCGGRSGYKSQTSPYNSHHSCEIGISLGFYGYCRDRSGHGLRPENFLHITMVDYTLSTQGYLNNIFQGV